MLKIFKWIYKLGYKDAEQKYFHALRSRTLSPNERDLQEVMMRDPDTSKEDRNLIYRKIDVDDKLLGIIDDVFYPSGHTEHVVIDKKSRFLP